MPDSGKRLGDLSRLRSISASLERCFVEALVGEGLELEDQGVVCVSQGDVFVPGADMVTMMDFSGEVSGFAAVAVDSAHIRHLLDEPEQWTMHDMAEDMIKEFLNQAAQDALNQVRTENGIISCSAPRTIYGTVSIPKIPCVTRSYPDSPLKPSFSMALDRMESALMRLNRTLLAREQALRSEIERRRLAEERLEVLASTDALTGSTTRRKFMEVASECLALSRAERQPMSMILIDVDHFKKINDTYGHAGGDAVLRELGHFLRQAVRGMDIVGRLGGEEFGVCLPETHLDQAAALAERIRRSLASQEIHLQDGQNIHCTASIGVAQLIHEDAGIEALLHRADLAMYESKRAGRNRVARAA